MNYRRLSATVGFTGCALFAVMELGQSLFRSDHGLAEPMSNYALGRYGYLQTIAFAALGLGSAALCAGLSSPRPSRRWRFGRQLLVGWSVGVLLAAAFPVDGAEPSATGQVHGVASGLSFMAVVGAMFVLSAAFADLPHWASFSRLSSRLAGTAAVTFVVAGGAQGSVAFAIARGCSSGRSSAG